MHLFSAPLKHRRAVKLSDVFGGVEKGCIGGEWVSICTINSPWVIAIRRELPMGGRYSGAAGGGIRRRRGVSGCVGRLGGGYGIWGLGFDDGNFSFWWFVWNLGLGLVRAGVGVGCGRGVWRAVSGLADYVQVRELGMCAPDLPRFTLLVSSSDILLVVSILGIV